MMDLGSIAGLHRHEHTLACYRMDCDRCVVLDLAAMIDAGNGVRRRGCGEAGRLKVPPASGFAQSDRADTAALLTASLCWLHSAAV